MRRLFKKKKTIPAGIEAEVSTRNGHRTTLKELKHPQTNLSIKEKLLANYAEGLERIVLWLPLFIGAWLSSGFVLKNLNILALVSIPLLLHFIFRTRKGEVEIFLEKEIQIFTRTLPYICALYLYSEQRRIDLSICLIFCNLFLEGHFLSSKRNSLLLILKALSTSLFMAVSAQMGILTQLTFTSLSDVFLGYCILGLIPGTVLTARNLLLSVDEFSSLAWKLGSITTDSKTRPSNYTKLVVLLMILGPAIPAILLPFNILPMTFISSSLVFFIIPKIAEKIQNTDNPLELKALSINLTILAFSLEVLVTISALLGA